MTYHNIENKDIGFAKSKRRIRVHKPIYHSAPNFDFYFIWDLAARIDSLQRAIAQERGETQRLREQVRAFMQRGHW